jgi:hypothetical protein
MLRTMLQSLLWYMTGIKATKKLHTASEATYAVRCAGFPGRGRVQVCAACSAEMQLMLQCHGQCCVSVLNSFAFRA